MEIKNIEATRVACMEGNPSKYITEIIFPIDEVE